MCKINTSIIHFGLLFASGLFFENLAAQDNNASTPTELALAKREAEDFEKLAALVKPSVVVVESVDRVGREGGRGTGFVVSGDGVIATNFHVIGEHRDFSIRFSNGKSFRPVSIIGIDRDRDLALIKIDAENLPTLKLGDSDKLKPGEAVLSLGNPLGYAHSVSRGVVAALRELELGDGRPMVQVAIPIEPGSSGSPALDLEGNVIAVLSIKSGGAMGFGVPVNELKKLMSESTEPIPIKKWLTIGTLDELEWKPVMNGFWKQRAGIIRASGLGSGFGGRMVCLYQGSTPTLPYEIEVEVKLEDERGAGGLVFHADGKDTHYGFYPTSGSLRLTRFEGPSVFNWTILRTVDSQVYRPYEWNLLQVQLQEDGRMVCSVNGEVVIDLKDLALVRGKVGLCKFREPIANFRNFRFAKRFPKSKVTPKIMSQVRKLTRDLVSREELSHRKKLEIMDLGDFAPQAIKDYALELEKQASSAKKLAEEIRERLIIRELADSLSHEDEHSVDLLRSALLIARLDNAHFDLDGYLRKADLFAQKIEKKFSDEANNEQRLRILVSQLFDEMGFHGSTLDYHHRSNSYMNEVMDDREGLPITLSILLIELANRLNLPVSGLGLPGHFMAIYREPLDKKDTNKRAPTKEILIDAFGGKIINRREASDITGVLLSELSFEPTSKKDIITRMLRNLIQSAEREQDQESKLRYMGAILAISPNDRYTRAMRAMIHYEREEFDKTLRDIDFLLLENPESPENLPLQEIRTRLIERGLIGHE